MKEGNRLLLLLRLLRRALLLACGGGVVASTYLTYVSLSSFFFVSVLSSSSSSSHLCLYVCDCLSFRFASLLVVFISSSLRAKIFTLLSDLPFCTSASSSASSRGSLSPLLNKHTHTHERTNAHRHKRTRR